jgi:hypothetical protein
MRADDRMVAWAFNAKVTRWGPIWRDDELDIGHWDVNDMTEVVEEA